MSAKYAFGVMVSVSGGVVRVKLVRVSARDACYGCVAEAQVDASIVSSLASLAASGVLEECGVKLYGFRVDGVKFVTVHYSMYSVEYNRSEVAVVTYLRRGGEPPYSLETIAEESGRANVDAGIEYSGLAIFCPPCINRGTEIASASIRAAVEMLGAIGEMTKCRYYSVIRDVAVRLAQSMVNKRSK